MSLDGLYFEMNKMINAHWKEGIMNTTKLRLLYVPLIVFLLLSLSFGSSAP